MSSSTQLAPWTRSGLVLARTATGDGSVVVGDPCIVWDPEIGGWRMILFYAPPGHGQSHSPDPTGAPGTWTDPEPLVFTNPEVLPPGGGTHKPFVVMDAARPNRAAHVDGRYWLVSVVHDANSARKRAHRAWSTSLAGPWTFEEGDLIPVGEPGAFDDNHVDVVSGYWFEERQEWLYYYMGCPLTPRPWAHTPFGSAIGFATQRPGEPAVKGGIALEPSRTPGHWASGYLGGLQLLPGKEHRWVGVINASPTPPDRDGHLTSEEPAPCLGGLVWTDDEWPVSGWRFADEPLEWVADIPQDARAAGEEFNLWRQHVLALEGESRLFYNSGYYGVEQMYAKTIDLSRL
ncbi:hypothetical protein [Kineococcus glutinatus]|uniref:Glycosyl hydrolase family 43 n=1 Tax=Kineococcus glutinatus TaxID=1070872 RepID=A0ABP9HDT9_9ACTN